MIKKHWWWGGLLSIALAADAQEIGSVDTAFQWLGPNHKIVIEAFDDPKIDGVCLLYTSPPRANSPKKIRSSRTLM